MPREEAFHSDPEIMSGTPVFVGTGVPVQNLIDYLEAGDGLEGFLRSFPTVTREQAVAAMAALLTRLEPPVDEAEVEQAWQEEVERRITAVDSGQAELIPWEKVRSELLARLNERP